MTDACARDHTLISDIELVKNSKGETEFKFGDYPDMVIGTGDTKELAEKDAKKKARDAAATFCAKKKCAAGKACVWSDITEKFDFVEKYMTEGMGWFAVLRLEIITCKCK